MRRSGWSKACPRAPQSELDLPDMLIVRPTLILVFDGLSDELFCIAPLWADGGDPRSHRSNMAGERIDEALRRLAAASPPPVKDACPASRWRSNRFCPQGHYESMVLKAKDYIEAGDIFQVVLAQRFTCPFPLAAIRALPRAAAGKSFTLPLFPRPARLRGGRIEPGNPCARARWRGDDPPDRRNPPARQDARRRIRPTSTACWPMPRSAPNI